ncbi:MAG: hypothetical protein CMH52_12460 [Myxococcales bacterium]|nr:hypothetical protein [Myxococcales bacterium]
MAIVTLINSHPPGLDVILTKAPTKHDREPTAICCLTAASLKPLVGRRDDADWQAGVMWVATDVICKTTDIKYPFWNGIFNPFTVDQHTVISSIGGEVFL